MENDKCNRTVVLLSLKFLDAFTNPMKNIRLNYCTHTSFVIAQSVSLHEYINLFLASVSEKRRKCLEEMLKCSATYLKGSHAGCNIHLLVHVGTHTQAV